MHLEDLDFVALINQMWGSEENLKAFLDSEVPRLCARICGPSAPVPEVQVTVPPLKEVGGPGNEHQIESASFGYRVESHGLPAKIYISVLYAGNRPKLPQFIAYVLIFHWEALGAIGEDACEYPGAAHALIREICTERGVSDVGYEAIHSPRFVAKAIRVAQDLELTLRDFLFPKLSLTVTYPNRGKEQTN